jgi:penicillin amidase
VRPRIGRTAVRFEAGRRAFTLRRDVYGVMHAAAADDLALATAYGFAHAHDRALQMLLVKAIGQGRLSELLEASPESLSIDLFMRKNLFAACSAEEAAKLDGRALELADAYAAGVNARLARGIPWELRLLRVPREAWTSADTLLTLRLMSFVGLAQAQGDVETLVLQALRAGVDREKLERLFRPHLDALDDASLAQIRQVKHVPALAPGLPPLPALRASNAVAVAGRLSASGSALYAGDPHLEVNRLPAVWYEVVGELPDGDFRTGVTVPGVPGLVMGRTRAIAGGFTYGFADTMDFVIEEVKDGTFRRGDGWVPLRDRRETIRRKNGTPVEVAVFESDAGILETPDDVTSVGDGLWLARAWTCRRDGGAASLEAILDVWSAPDVERAMDAAARVAISATWLFSGRDGRIGAQQSGLVPRRRGAPDLLPLRGWEDGDRRDGNLPPSALARVLDPQEGILVSANDGGHGAFSPVGVSFSMGNDRACRLRELLAEKSAAGRALAAPDLGEMQADLVSGQARRLLAALDADLPDLPAVRLLRAWDRRYDTASKGAVVFERLYAALCEGLFGEGLFGPEAWRALRDTSLVHPFYFCFFDDVLAREEGPVWFGGEERREYVARVARAELGAVDPDAVPAWGETRRVSMKHLLFGGRLPPFLGFDRGPIEVAGGRATVVQGQVLNLAGRESSFCPSWRFVADLATDAAETALAGGPSDRRFSRWYATDVARWLSFERKTLRPGG